MHCFWSRPSGIPDLEFPGIGAVSVLSQEFPGILKASGFSKTFVQNFDKIQQNFPHLLL